MVTKGETELPARLEIVRTQTSTAGVDPYFSWRGGAHRWGGVIRAALGPSGLSIEAPRWATAGADAFGILCCRTFAVDVRVSYFGLGQPHMDRRSDRVAQVPKQCGRLFCTTVLYAEVWLALESCP